MNKDIKHICIIASSYPTPNNPKNTFVDQLVCAWADLGIKCTVIAPNSITKGIIRRSANRDLKFIRKTERENEIQVYSPKYITFSSINILGFNTMHLTLKSFKKIVEKQFKKLNDKPDVVYGHFINPCGITAAYIGKKYNIPSFLAYGESSPEKFEMLGNNYVRKALCNINGVVSVSSENKRRLIERNIVKTEKIRVFPNAIDDKLFYKRDKNEMRKKLGYNEADFIVSFVGQYIERKGPNRLAKALDDLDGVKSIFIGNGEQVPRCRGIIHTGRVEHNKIPEMLNASDVFVLPTLNEGCCNAIVEAMACGLPIISSNRPFNEDILFDNNSIKIEPLNIMDIKSAIELLQKNDQIRIKMSEASLKNVENFKLINRAKKIIEFMKQLI